MIKNSLITSIFLLSALFGMHAQDISKHAIGLRFGDDNGFGAEISYQLGLQQNNRLELDLGWRNQGNINAIKATGLYQWVFNLDRGFNWYVGPGGGIGFWSIDNTSNENNSGSFLFIAGTVGLEYNFEFPLLVSLDFRPEIGFGDFKNNLDFDIGLGVRYQF